MDGFTHSSSSISRTDVEMGMGMGIGMGIGMGMGMGIVMLVYQAIRAQAELLSRPSQAVLQAPA